MASLQSRISDLITAIGADYKRYHGVYTVADVASITPSQSYNQYQVTALAQTLSLVNPTAGNMNAGQPIIFRFKDNGTGRTLSWGTNYRAIGLTLPTVTTANKTLYVGCKWNATDGKVDVIAIAVEA